MPFDASERQSLLREYFELSNQLLDMTASFDDDAGTVVEGARESLSAVQDRLWALSEKYERGVPVIPLSRCPFTGQQVLNSLDTFGLDGLWWEYNSPVRPKENLPNTYFALTGAVKLAEKLEDFPFLCCPGPEVPYVVPRLLEHPHIKAVVSSTQVGNHEAFPVFYFADPVPYDIDRVNTWGAEHYSFVDSYGEFRWNSSVESPGEFDYDLEKWIRAGKLLWIRPGDAKLILRSDVNRCPYLSLEGRRATACIQRGKAWSATDLNTA